MRHFLMLSAGAAAVMVHRVASILVAHKEQPDDCPWHECQNFTWWAPAPGDGMTTAFFSPTSILADPYIVKEGCGDICFTHQRVLPGNAIQKRVNCPALFSNTAADAPMASWPPPKEPPANYRKDFLMGLERVVGYDVQYFAQRIAGTEAGFGKADEIGWNDAHIRSLVRDVAAGKIKDGYGDAETQAILTMVMRHRQEFDGKHVLVVGSVTPWLEAVFVHIGARNVTTLDYGILPRNPHPKVNTMTPAELADAFLAGQAPKFEAGASYSSIEHSGLGRYGEALNPWADLQTMAKVWCVMEPGAPFLLGVPTGKDSLTWNAGRRYGNLRLPHLTANWELVETGPSTPSGQVATLYRKGAAPANSKLQ